MTGYAEKLERAIGARNSRACVGLDPIPELMPAPDVAQFNRLVVDATHDLACAYKLQLAFYEALGISGFRALEDTVEYIRRCCLAPGRRQRGPDLQNQAAGRPAFEFTTRRIQIQRRTAAL